MMVLSSLVLALLPMVLLLRFVMGPVGILFGSGLVMLIGLLIFGLEATGSLAEPPQLPEPVPLPQSFEAPVSPVPVLPDGVGV